MIYFLIGYMGSGKSTLGKVLARRTGYSFVDMDTEIERRNSKTISEIFAQYGEEHFRQAEKELIEEIARGEFVCSDQVPVGQSQNKRGGAVQSEENKDTQSGVEQAGCSKNTGSAADRQAKREGEMHCPDSPGGEGAANPHLQREKAANMIVATGGGVPCYGDNMQRMKQAGCVIYLKMSPAKLVGRLRPGKAKRPKIAGLDDQQMLEFIQFNLEARAPHYEQASLIIDCEGVSDDYICRHIEGFIDYNSNKRG